MTDLRSACDLCASSDALVAVPVPPETTTVTLCALCAAGVEGDVSDAPHWRCLGDAIWSEDPAVQVTAWRLLDRLKGAIWARDVLEAAYLAPDVQAWAEAGAAPEAPEAGDVHRDCNGVALAAGDTVTLTKDLTVKGAEFTAKRGTAVRSISLVADNAGQIEGRVNGQHIVILTQFVKKSA